MFHTSLDVPLRQPVAACLRLEGSGVIFIEDSARADRPKDSGFTAE